MGWYYGTGWGGALAMALSMVLWFGILWFLVSGIFRWISSRDSQTVVMSPSALEMLRQRYVRNEIDEATFERMSQTLAASEARDRTAIPR